MVLDVHRQAKFVAQRGFEAGDVPVLSHLVVVYVAAGEGVNDVDAHAGDELGDVVGVHDVGALGVDDFALFVGDVVVFEQVFARVEVVRFDFALCAFDLFGDHARFDSFVFAHAEALHHACHAFAREDADEVVIEGDVEAAGAGVALAAGAAAQLVVDAA